MNIEIFKSHYSTGGTQDDRAESFKRAALLAYDGENDRPFTADETRDMLDAADAADHAVFYHSTPGGTD